MFSFFFPLKYTIQEGLTNFDLPRTVGGREAPSETTNLPQKQPKRGEKCRSIPCAMITLAEANQTKWPPAPGVDCGKQIVSQQSKISGCPGTRK